MRKVIERIIEIPEGVEVGIEGNKFTVKGNGHEVVREFDLGKVAVVSKDGKIVISAKDATRRETKIAGTAWAHLKNMIKGLGEDFVYKLEICNVHFPMNVKVDGNRVVIKSFLGETVERVAEILPDTKVDVKGSEISVSSYNIEAAGQTAANIEKATRLKGRDRRIFQDGIFIKEKCGRLI